LWWPTAWKVFGVIRRHTRVGTTGSQEIAMPSIELAAGTTAGKAAENCGRSTTDEVLVEVAT